MSKFDDYLAVSNNIRQKMIVEMGEEAYEASEHWVNNPLIGMVSKVDMFEESLERERLAERERIIKLLEENHSWAWQHDPVSQDSCASCESIALIKGSQNVGAEIDNPSEGENK